MFTNTNHARHARHHHRETTTERTSKTIRHGLSPLSKCETEARSNRAAAISLNQEQVTNEPPAQMGGSRAKIMPSPNNQSTKARIFAEANITEVGNKSAHGAAICHVLVVRPGLTNSSNHPASPLRAPQPSLRRLGRRLRCLRHRAIRRR